ncbi:hypothetical protein [Microbacterium sp.]|uniref:hypothetical protein n=1 Tax=Microbacterium sp. TaxID=51671 RepID=UPI0032424F71
MSRRRWMPGCHRAGFARDLATPFRAVRSRPPAEPAAADLDAAPAANEDARLRLTIQRAAQAYATRAVPGILFTHVTAAVIWGLPLPLRLLRRSAEAIDVAVLGERRGPKGAGGCGAISCAPSSRRSSSGAG